MTGPRITAFCPTLNRPDLLPRMIACFEAQSYANRELVIIDDGGQYENQKGDRWELVSVPRRFRSLGEKNNAAMAMASPDSSILCKADDDDWYASWWMESIVDAFEKNPKALVCQPRFAVDFHRGEWVQIETFNRANPDSFCYHGCFAYRRELIEMTGGYRPLYAGDDGEFDGRLKAMGIKSVGIDESKYRPFYKYNRPLPGRISERGGSREAYLATGNNVPYVGKLKKWEGEITFEMPTKRIQRWW